jgi:hypothetical protein
LFLETQIERIVEKHIPPRITKGDLLKVISESEPAIAPTKPTTKPGTKPAPTTNPDFDPFISPDPDDQPEAKGLDNFVSKVKLMGLIKKHTKRK